MIKHIVETKVGDLVMFITKKSIFKFLITIIVLLAIIMGTVTLYQSGRCNCNDQYSSQCECGCQSCQDCKCGCLSGSECKCDCAD